MILHSTHTEIARRRFAGCGKSGDAAAVKSKHPSVYCCDRKRKHTAMDPRIAAFAHYYAREGQGEHVAAVCGEVLRRGGGGGGGGNAAPAALRLWHAVGLLLGGAGASANANSGGVPAQALCELERLLQQQQHDGGGGGDDESLVGAAAAAALLHARELAGGGSGGESSGNVSESDPASLRARVEEGQRSATGEGAIHLAAVLSLAGAFEAARGALERCVREAPPLAAAGGALSPPAAAAAAAARLRATIAWTILQQQRAEAAAAHGGACDAGELAAAGELLRAALAADPNDLEAAMALARLAELRGRHSDAAAAAEALAARAPWFAPALAERARLLLAAGDWAGAAGAAARLLEADGGSATGLAVAAMAALRDGDARGAGARLAALAEATGREEPRNARLALRLVGPRGCF